MIHNSLELGFFATVIVWLVYFWRKERKDRLADRRQLRQMISTLESDVQRGNERISIVEMQRDTLQGVVAAREEEVNARDEDLRTATEHLAYWQATAERFETRYEAAYKDAIDARSMVTDWLAQRTFGRTIFTKAPPLPESSLHKKPLPKSRIQGRLAVRLAEQRTARQEEELRRQQEVNPPKPVTVNQ